MKVSFSFPNGLRFEVEGNTPKEIFERWAEISEVFGEKSCGLCGKTDLTPRIRHVVKDDEEYDYYELVCNAKGCGAKLAYGLNKKPVGGMFPKRQDDNGKYDWKTRGWKKWAANGNNVAATPKQQPTPSVGSEPEIPF